MNTAERRLYAATAYIYTDAGTQVQHGNRVHHTYLNVRRSTDGRFDGGSSRRLIASLPHGPFVHDRNKAIRRRRFTRTITVSAMSDCQAGRSL